MIIKAAIALVMACMALLGLYTLVIVIHHDRDNISYEQARIDVDRNIKRIVIFLYDHFNKRPEFRLEWSEFPSMLKNDIQALLSDAEYEHWCKRFNMTSVQMEMVGDYFGLPYYSICLYVSNKQMRNDYEAIIRNHAIRALGFADCYPEILTTWEGIGDNQSFQWISIWYSRNENERRLLQKKINAEESGNDEAFNTGRDDELDEMLKKNQSNSKGSSKNDRKDKNGD